VTQALSSTRSAPRARLNDRFAAFEGRRNGHAGAATAHATRRAEHMISNWPPGSQLSSVTEKQLKS